MITTIKSFLLHGLDAVPVTVECKITAGIGVHLVGLRDSAVKECLLRTVTALTSNGFRIPGRKVVINVSPATNPTSRNDTSGLDLPIALAVLVASEQIPVPSSDGFLIAGELGLDGSVRTVPGGYPAGILAAEQNFSGVILPKEAAMEIPRRAGIKRYAVTSLAQAIRILAGHGEGIIEDEAVENNPAMPQAPAVSAPVLRGLEIAAAGGFDVLFSAEADNASAEEARLLAARTLAYLTEDPRDEDARRRIASVSGCKFSNGGVLRCPHPSASLSTLFGGSAAVLPGEVTLAHGGVLLLTDVEAMSKTVLESLRRVHEDVAVTLARLGDRVTYPARFSLAACCPAPDCGRMPHHFDGIMAQTHAVHIFLRDRETKPSQDMAAASKDRVLAARRLLRSRHDGALPAEVPSRMLARPSGDMDGFLETIMLRMNLSARVYFDLLRIAETIAALDGRMEMTNADVCEAAGWQFLARQNNAA